jgi:cyclase
VAKRGNGIESITNNVCAVTDRRGCNPGYVVTGDGVVMIDSPQLPSDALRLREEILKKGPLRFLINTEWHIDHIFGNRYFEDLCPVISHKFTRESFWGFRPGVDAYDYMVEMVKNEDPDGLANMPTRENFGKDYPAITFTDQMTLHVGDHVFEIMTTPGHTKGQTAVYVPKERVVFVGDTIFCERQVWFQSADPEKWIQSLDFLQSLDVDYIIPGHGPVCDKSYILKQSAYIREWITAVATGMVKGWSKSECLERIDFLDRFPMDYGHEKDGAMVQGRNIERIFDYLLGKLERF